WREGRERLTFHRTRKTWNVLTVRWRRYWQLCVPGGNTATRRLSAITTPDGTCAALRRAPQWAAGTQDPESLLSTTGGVAERCDHDGGGGSSAVCLVPPARGPATQAGSLAHQAARHRVGAARRCIGHLPCVGRAAGQGVADGAALSVGREWRLRGGFLHVGH